MARTRTDATERTEQNRRLVEQVSAELGRKVTVREARAHRKVAKVEPVATYSVVDRVVAVDPAVCRRIGQVLGRVSDYKATVNSGLAQLILTVDTPEFGHTCLDAAVASRGRTLLITLDVIGDAV